MRPLDQNTLSKVESFSNEYQKANGLSPSFRQIMHEVRLGSVATARRYVLALESEGRIQRTNLGNIETPTRLKKGGTTMALLVGDIACGDPTESEENIEENIELPNDIFGGGDLFLLHAKGDSMIGAGIEKGDLLVIRKQNSAFYGCSKLTSITFNDTTTWYRTNSLSDWQNKTGGTLTDVTSPSTNATYFKSNFSNYYWYKLDN